MKPYLEIDLPWLVPIYWSKDNSNNNNNDNMIYLVLFVIRSCAFILFSVFRLVMDQIAPW